MPLDRDHEDRGDLPWRKWIPGEETAELAGGPRVSTPSVPVFWRRGWGWTELRRAPACAPLRLGCSLAVVLRTFPHPRPTAASWCSVLKRVLAFAQPLVHGPCAAAGAGVQRASPPWAGLAAGVPSARAPSALELVPPSVRREGGPPPAPLPRRVFSSLS